jgi:hypothetical protein
MTDEFLIGFCVGIFITIVTYWLGYLYAYLFLE